MVLYVHWHRYRLENTWSILSYAHTYSDLSTYCIFFWSKYPITADWLKSYPRVTASCSDHVIVTFISSMVRASFFVSPEFYSNHHSFQLCISYCYIITTLQFYSAITMFGTERKHRRECKEFRISEKNHIIKCSDYIKCYLSTWIFLSVIFLYRMFALVLETLLMQLWYKCLECWSKLDVTCL